MGQRVTGKLQKLFNSVELRLFVLLSLLFQVVLIAIGSRRKYTRKKRIAIVVWICYLSADFVATASLGFLSRAEMKNDPRDAVMAFWAPFLLMHLGGPDTITAYALADNELWLRHALGLFGQVVMALYVLIRSWAWTWINYLWILVFVAGLIKYVERTLVLFSASRDQFRDSMVTPPDPGPNYAKLMAEFVSKREEGYKVEIGEFENDNSSSVIFHPPADVHQSSSIEDAVLLQEAYYFYSTFKKLFADLVLSIQDKENSFSFFNKVVKDWEKAFSIVEIELGLIYDLLYTKAFLIYSKRGFFLRAVTFSCTVVSLVIFVVIHVKLYPKFKVLNKDKKSVSVMSEVIISYVLLGGAVLLELYAVMIMVSSDRTMIWLSGRKSNCPTFCKTVSFLRCLNIVPAKKRWSNVVGQYNFLDSCFESEPKCCVKLNEYLEKKYFFWKRARVPDGLKALIFTELKSRVNSDNNEMKVGSYKGADRIWLKQTKILGKDTKKEVEFDRSLLLWHVATDLCYYKDVEEERKVDGAELKVDGVERKVDGVEHKVDKTWLHHFIPNNEENKDNLKFKREICKLLSDYMMHLLIMSPFMLPSGIGKMRFQDTRAEAIEFFDGDTYQSRKAEACAMLGGVDTRLKPYQLKGDRSKSVLFEACRVAKSMQSQEFGDKKWDIMKDAWLDMLTYAAAQCSWSDHAEKLGEGGELLSHVWLLMAHLGMTDHFQVSLEHFRAKLVVK